MINIINNLIELNLQIIFKSKNYSLKLNDFKDEFGNQFQDAETFARLMKVKKLITNNPKEEFCFQLTEFGTEICENGGWLEYLKKRKQTAKEKVVEKKTEPKKNNKKGVSIFLIIAFLGLLVAYFFIIDKKY
jgi:3-isopropylmalate dehydratase small subunit